MLQLLLSPVNNNENHYHSVSAFKQNAVHTMLMLAASRICGNTWKWEIAQFSPLDQINGAVNMSKQYKYLWYACSANSYAWHKAHACWLKTLILIWGCHWGLGPWIFLDAVSMNPTGYFHRKQMENWTKNSLAVLIPCLPFFFLATWNLSHSHAICKWHVYLGCQWVKSCPTLIACLIFFVSFSTILLITVSFFL